MEDKVYLNPVEKLRTYYFKGGGKVVLENVHSLRVSESGTHYLETGDGRKHIIPAGWIHIELVVNEWTL